MSATSIPAEEKLRHLECHHADRVTTFRQRLAQIGPDQVMLILLDIGKNAHWAAVSTGSGQRLAEPFRLPTNRVGLDEFTLMVDTLTARHQPQLVILGHEPSGVYHETWARDLLARYAPHLEGRARPAFEYRFFNPYQVKLARQQTHLRHRKTDPRDLAAMYDLALRGLGYPAFLPTDVEMLVRQEVGFIRAQARLLSRMEIQLRQQLDRLWPQAVVRLKYFRQAHPNLPDPTPIIQSRPLQRKRLRVLLAHCPNPYDLQRMSDSQILALFRKHMGRAGPALLRTLRTWLDNAVLLPPDVAEPLAEQIRRLFLQYVHTETIVEEGRGRLLPLVPHTRARHLPAIPGLGEHDAACYLAGIGSIHRFSRPAEVWAFAGFDPVSDGSGDQPDRVGHLSKRGDPAFRDSLYRMSYRVAQYYAPVGLTFLDAFDRGKSEVEATIHAAHRVNRICFHLMKQDEPFVDQTTREQAIAWKRRWKQFKAKKRKRGGRRRRGKRRR